MLKMEEVYIGKIVNTHGIKGELRILSDFLISVIPSFSYTLFSPLEKELH